MHTHTHTHTHIHTGLSHQELLEELQKRKKAEVDPHTGKIFAYVYTSEDTRFQIVQKAFDMFEFEGKTDDGQLEEDAEAKQLTGSQTVKSTSSTLSVSSQKEAIVQMFFHAFMHENALNPLVFPSLKQFETEIVAMVANMLHGDGRVVGSVTSGGTESILLAMKSYRDRARHLFPHIKQPEIVRANSVLYWLVRSSSYL